MNFSLVPNLTVNDCSLNDIVQLFDEIFKSKWIFWEMKTIEIGQFRNSETDMSRKKSFSKQWWSIHKLLLVSSRFVCATVIQVNNRSRYTAAVFTSLYVIVSTTSQFVNDELIIKMWMANMSTSYYLISDRLRLHTEWVFPSVCKGAVKYFLNYYYLLDFLQQLHSE